jgi:hypothetical protein
MHHAPLTAIGARGWVVGLELFALHFTFSLSLLL